MASDPSLRVHLESSKIKRFLSQKKDSDLASSTVHYFRQCPKHHSLQRKHPAPIQGLQQALCSLPQLGRQEGGMVYLTLLIYSNAGRKRANS